MRSGRLLAEESPAALLATYRCKNLEDVFLQLSRKQGTTNAVNELNISNLSLSALAFGNKKDAPVYISQDSGVVGLNFHQSKEVLINDYNGSAPGVSVPDHNSIRPRSRPIFLVAPPSLHVICARFIPSGHQTSWTFVACVPYIVFTLHACYDSPITPLLTILAKPEMHIKYI